MRAILTYHSIDSSGSPISLDVGVFRRHVEWWASGHVMVTGVCELLALPPDVDAVALTFDDGFTNFASEAWPLLHEHGLPSTLFVVTDRVGDVNRWDHGRYTAIPRLPLVDWETIGRLAAGGVEIGSHGCTHARLDRVGPVQLENEIAGSASVIEREIGIRPVLFSYPYGRPSHDCLPIVRAHYRGAVTAELRLLDEDDDPFLLPRIDAWYLRAPGAIERWGTTAFRRRLWLRQQARRVHEMKKTDHGRRRARMQASGPLGAGPPARSTVSTTRAVSVAGSHGRAARAQPSASVTVVIPVLNEAHVLERSVQRVREFLSGLDDWSWRVMIIDNGSTDGTREVARALASRYPDVDFCHLDKPGRGGALRHAWSRTSSDVVCYTDVDLSTDLEALPRLLSSIRDEGYDVATGSRLMKGSNVVRGLKRDVVSRGYNHLLRFVLRSSFSDAQCGFKAVSQGVVDTLVPQIRDDAWFFDSELLVLAERGGYRIKEVAITWIEDDDSRVKIIRTGWEDVKGILRLRWTFWRRDLGSFLGRLRSSRQPAVS
jgi:peptidoglycan/xylan/chitin deacetylase (PgdA/CDA1 family)